MKFAKLFEIKDDQLLITKGYNDDDDIYNITITTDVNGVRLTFTLSYNDQEDCDTAFSEFSEYSEFQAKMMLTNITKQFNSNEEETD